MYATASARETRPEVLLQAVREMQLAALVIATPDGFAASHLPVVVCDRGDGPLLECHVARKNPLWEQVGGGCPALATFQGPHAYIHPGWFTSISAADGAVPTWTYIAVHVHGRLKVVQDESWLRRHLGQLASNNEAHRSQPWSLSDVPADRTQSLLAGIVGLELTIERMEGSWKMAQGLPDEDRRAVAAALAASGEAREAEVAAVMTDLLHAKLSGPRG